MPSYKDLPSFEEARNGLDSTIWGPKGSVEEGKAMLNLLTPEVKLRAMKEVTQGRSIGLNWNLKFLGQTSFGRLPFSHKIVGIEGFEGALDDEYHMNPQSGSQWDGLRHWADSKTGLFYGGQTKEVAADPTNSRMGVGAWSVDGIVGRGVLLDFAAYAKKNNISYDPFSYYPVSLKVLQEIIADQKVSFLPGDILFVRFGYTSGWEALPVDIRQQKASSQTQAIGLEESEEMLRFIWDNHFAACVGDNIALETMPFKNMEHSLHDHLLARWGVPIGEMWYLETLAEACAKAGKYTFLLASAPFNQPCGVSSVPNSVAIF